MNGQFTKDPSSTLDYTIDWSGWLGTDEIIDTTWTVPSGLKNVKNTNTTTTATIWLSGGDPGITYSIECEISTDQGRIDSRQLTIFITNK